MFKWIRLSLLLALGIMTFISCNEAHQYAKFDKEAAVAVKCFKLKGIEAHPERHNPFDIIYTSGSKVFQGCIGEEQGFCRFESDEMGCRAGLIIIVHGYFAKGYDTPEKFVCRYSATDQESYIGFICEGMGKIGRHQKMPHTNDTYCKLGHLITIYEGQEGKNGISTQILADILKKYNIKGATEYEIIVPAIIKPEVKDNVNLNLEDEYELS